MREDVVKLRYDPGAIGKIKPVLATVDAQFFDRERRALREDQVRQGPELLDRDHTVGDLFFGVIDRFHDGGVLFRGLGFHAFPPSFHPIEDSRGDMKPRGGTRRVRFCSEHLGRRRRVGRHLRT